MTLGGSLARNVCFRDLTQKSPQDECPLQECRARMSHGPTRVSQNCATEMLQDCVPPVCPTSVSHRTISYKSAFYKGVLHERPTRMLCTRVSHRTVSSKGVPQERRRTTECPTRASSHKSVPQESGDVRSAFYKSVLLIVSFEMFGRLVPVRVCIRVRGFLFYV